MDSKRAWAMVTTASAGLAAAAVRGAMKRGWRLWKAEDPPPDPAAPDVDWKDALLWAGATGAVVGIARVLAQRGVATGWRAVTGRPPPG